MKTMLILLALIITQLTAFTQEEKNGDCYNYRKRSSKQR